MTLQTAHKQLKLLRIYTLFWLQEKHQFQVCVPVWSFFERQTNRSETSKMLLCLVLPHIITICDGKADFAQIFTVFKVHHYMSLAHAHSDIIRKYLSVWELNLVSSVRGGHTYYYTFISCVYFVTNCCINEPTKSSFFSKWCCKINNLPKLYVMVKWLPNECVIAYFWFFYE